MAPLCVPAYPLQVPPGAHAASAVVGAAVEEEAPQPILVGVAALQRRPALTHLALLSPESVKSVLHSLEQVFTPTDL